MGQFDPSGWSTVSYSPSDRFEAWAQQLGRVYCNFAIDRPIKPAFDATMRFRSADGLEVVECVCDPCGAVRRSREIARDERQILGIQLVLDGREHICFDGEEIELGRGDILVWDSTRPMRFAVRERLHKISIVLPLARFHHWRPGSWRSIQRRLDGSVGAASVLARYIGGLPGHFIGDRAIEGDALTEATLALLTHALGRNDDQDTATLRGAQLFRIRHFIDENLFLPDLAPPMIAAAHRISIRYLHWLFEETGDTVLQFIIKERLKRCRRELATPAMHNRTITDIALSWGFHDLTHFSRRFRQEFGQSPLEFRRQALHGEQTMTR
ncbi:MAG: helix-turn-helix domain-containing protein [Steroidobacteraceae bacterium]